MSNTTIKQISEAAADLAREDLMAMAVKQSAAQTHLLLAVAEAVSAMLRNQNHVQSYLKAGELDALIRQFLQSSTVSPSSPPKG